MGDGMSDFVWYWCRICRRTFPLKELLRAHKKHVHFTKHDKKMTKVKCKLKRSKKLHKDLEEEALRKFFCTKSITPNDPFFHKGFDRALSEGMAADKLNGSLSMSVMDTQSQFNLNGDLNINKKLITLQPIKMKEPPIPVPNEASDNFKSDKGAGNSGKFVQKKSEHLNNILEKLKLIAVQKLKGPPSPINCGDNLGEKMAKIPVSQLESLPLKSALPLPVREGKKRKEDCRCKFCLKVLSSPRNLRDHVRAKHTGEKPYKCPSCFKKFASAKNVSGHMRKIHGLPTRPMGRPKVNGVGLSSVSVSVSSQPILEGHLNKVNSLLGASGDILNCAPNLNKAVTSNVQVSKCRPNLPEISMTISQCLPDLPQASKCPPNLPEVTVTLMPLEEIEECPPNELNELVMAPLEINTKCPPIVPQESMEIEQIVPTTNLESAILVETKSNVDEIEAPNLNSEIKIPPVEKEAVNLNPQSPLQKILQESTPVDSELEKALIELTSLMEMEMEAENSKEILNSLEEKQLILSNKIESIQTRDNQLGQFIVPQVLNGWTFYFCNKCLNIFPYYSYAFRHVQDKHAEAGNLKDCDTHPIPEIESELKFQTDLNSNSKNTTVLSNDGTIKQDNELTLTSNPSLGHKRLNGLHLLNGNYLSLSIPQCDPFISREAGGGAGAGKKYFCNLCPQIFQKPSHAFRHARSHTNRPFKCEGCDMTFRIQGTLEIHRRRRHLKFKKLKPPPIILKEEDCQILNEAPEKSVTFYLAEIEEWPFETEEEDPCVWEEEKGEGFRNCENDSLKLFHFSGT